MPNDVINTVTIHGTTYGIGGSGGHTIKNPAGTAMTQRSNLQFVDLTISDDSTNNATKVESVHVIHSESELNNLPDGLYMLDEDEGIILDGSVVGYDNTASGLDAENVQDAIDEVAETLDAKADKVSSATNGNLAGLNGSGNPTDSGWNGAKGTTSISGNPISISGLKSNQLAINPIITLEPIQDLHGQSKPYPAGGGKNLLPLTVDGIKAENTDGTWSGNTYTIDGVTFTILVDNANNVIGINISGTSSTSSGSFLYLKRSFSVTANSILNGCPSGGSSNTYRLSMSGVGSDVGVGINVPANSTGNVYILRGNTSVSGTITFKPMIRLATETDATFAPPSNISPINGYDKVEALSCGINVWDEKWELGAYSVTDGSVITSTNSIRSKSTNYILIAPNKSYYMKYPGGYNLNICFYDVSRTFISNQVITASGIITTPTTAKYIRFNLSATYGTTYGNNISINYPATQTSYVASNKATSISESLGQTVYWGELDVRSGKFKVLGGRVDLGTIDWDIVESASTYKDFRNISMANVIKSVDSQVIANGTCEIFAMTSRNDQANNHPLNTIAVTLNGYIRVIANASYTDATAFKTDMSGVYFVYELTTPFYIQLTPHEISLLKDYAYVSTNGTNIALDYHNGELASLADVSQLGEMVNEILSNQTAIFSPSQNVSGVSEKHFFKVGNLVNISCRVTGTFNNGAYTDIGIIAYRPLNIMWFPLINRATGTLAGVIRLTTDGIISVLPSANLTDTYINLMFIANKQ